MSQNCLTNGCRCFSGKVETSDVSVSVSIVDELVCLDALVGGDLVVGAGDDVDEVEHLDEGLQHPGRVLQPAGARV